MSLAKKIIDKLKWVLKDSAIDDMEATLADMVEEFEKELAEEKEKGGVIHKNVKAQAKKASDVMKEDILKNSGIELNEKVDVRGHKREEATPDPKKLKNGKVTKEYKEKVQKEVDKNTEVFLNELKDVMDSYETFREKFNKLMKDEGDRRQKEGALRFGGRFTKLKSLYSKINDLIVALDALKYNR